MNMLAPVVQIAQAAEDPRNMERSLARKLAESQRVTSEAVGKMTGAYVTMANAILLSGFHMAFGTGTKTAETPDEAVKPETPEVVIRVSFQAGCVIRKR